MLTHFKSSNEFNRLKAIIDSLADIIQKINDNTNTTIVVENDLSANFWLKNDDEISPSLKIAMGNLRDLIIEMDNTNKQFSHNRIDLFLSMRKYIVCK